MAVRTSKATPKTGATTLAKTAVASTSKVAGNSARTIVAKTKTKVSRGTGKNGIKTVHAEIVDDSVDMRTHVDNDVIQPQLHWT